MFSIGAYPTQPLQRDGCEANDVEGGTQAKGKLHMSSASRILAAGLSPADFAIAVGARSASRAEVNNESSSSSLDAVPTPGSARMMPPLPLMPLSVHNRSPASPSRYPPMYDDEYREYCRRRLLTLPDSSHDLYAQEQLSPFRPLSEASPMLSPLPSETASSPPWWSTSIGEEASSRLSSPAVGLRGLTMSPVREEEYQAALRAAEAEAEAEARQQRLGGSSAGTGRSLELCRGGQHVYATPTPPATQPPPRRGQRDSRPHPLVTHVGWARGHSAAELAGLALPKAVDVTRVLSKKLAPSAPMPQLAATMRGRVGDLWDAQGTRRQSRARNWTPRVQAGTPVSGTQLPFMLEPASPPPLALEHLGPSEVRHTSPEVRLQCSEEL
jgi:hypothetical protein